MRKGRIFLFFLVGIFLVFSSLVSAENVTDYTDEYGFEVSVVGEGVSSEETQVGVKFIFGEDSNLVVGENRFENIIKSSTDFPSEIEIDSNGKVVNTNFNVNKNGGVFNINGIEFEAPPYSLVEYNEKEGLSITLNDGVSISSFPKLTKGDSVKLIGKDVILPGGKGVFSGKLLYDSEGLMVSSFSNEYINGMLITPLENPVRIYFESEEVKGSEYVYFGDSELIFSGEHIALSANEKNKYVKMEEGDKFFVLTSGGKVVLNKGESDKIANLKVYGDATINQDSKRLRSSGDKIIMSDSDFATSVPMQISFYDFDGKPLIEKFGKDFSSQQDIPLNSHELLIDNFNRFAIVPRSSEDEFTVSYDGIDTKFSSQLSYNYVTREEIDLLTGGKVSLSTGDVSYRGNFKDIPVEVITGEESLMLGRVRDYWNSLNRENKKAVRGINLFNQEFFNIIGAGDNWAAFDSGDSNLYFKAETFNISIFRHEVAHALNFYLNKEFEDDNIKKEWEGRRYSGNVGEDLLGIPSIFTYPKDGFIRRYGESRYEEDIATYLEKVNDPEFFRDLVDSDSESYNKEYIRKLKFLRKYKFITEEEYNRIFDF